MTFSLQVKNFPRSVKKAEVKKFFTGVKVGFIKLDNRGCGHIEVKNEESLNEALKFNSTKYNDRIISVSIMNEPTEVDDGKTKSKERQKFPSVDVNVLVEKIQDTGRLYIRNLSFDVTEADVVELFKEHGELVEVSLPYDHNLKRSKAFGFVTFMLPRDAVKAFQALDKTKFKGRKIHILPGEEKPEGQGCKGVLENTDKEETTTFKDAKKEELKSKASSAHNWNALFVNSDVVAQYLAHELGVSKSDLFSDAMKGSTSVKLALAETKLVTSIKQFLVTNHIRLDILEKITNRGPKSKGDVNISFALSSQTFIVKNLTPGVTKEELEEIFNKYKGLKEILLPPFGVTAIVSYELSQQAKVAYLNCAYMEFKESVMMLQWAPLDLFDESKSDETKSDEKKSVEIKSEKKKSDTDTKPVDNVSQILTKSERKARKRELKEQERENQNDCKKLKLDEPETESNETVDPVKESQEVDERTNKILVKNISFQATYKELEELFKPFPGITAIRLPKKTNGGHKGYCFVEFETEDQAELLMDSMGVSTHLLGRRLVMMYSNVE